jgi:Na+/pantothenate symporter
MLTFVALFVPMVSGLWLKQTSSLGAELSILSGVGFWFYAQHYHVTFLGVHIPSLLVGFSASAIAMLIGYLFTNSKFFTGKS